MRNLCIPVDKCIGVVHTLQELHNKPEILCKLLTSEKRGSDCEYCFDIEL